jgi:uncharacterized protein
MEAQNLSQVSEFFDIKSKVMDKLVNLVAGIGNKRDKTSYGRHYQTILGEQELLAMYKDTWIASKAVDIFAEDMTRKWRGYKGDKEMLSEFIKAEQKFGVKKSAYDAIKWARLYGGAAIIPVFKSDNNAKISQPLKIDKIRKGELSKLLVVDRTMINGNGVVQTNPLEDNFGFPEFYNVNGNLNRIHHSRVFCFYGVDLPYTAKQHNNYWGDSVIQRMYETINDASTTFHSTAQMMLEMVTDIIKIPNLSTFLATEEDTNKMVERFNLMKLMGSISQLKILDAEEEYERHQIQLPGVNDIITQFLTMVSAAANIPVTRFIGTSPRGMNATGESDLEIHYENVHSKQENELRPIMDKLDEIIQMATFGSLIEDYSFEFLPLYMQDDKELAETQEINSKGRASYMEAKILPKSTVARRLVDEGWDISKEHIAKLEEYDNNTEIEAPEPVVNAEPAAPVKEKPKTKVK